VDDRTHLPFLAGALPFALALILFLSTTPVVFLLDSLRRARFLAGGLVSLLATELEAMLLVVEEPAAFFDWRFCSTSSSSESSESDEDLARFLPLLLAEAEAEAD